MLSNYNNYDISSNIEDALLEKECIIRKLIDDSVLENLLENGNYTCNICNNPKGKDIIIHHIK